MLYHNSCYIKSIFFRGLLITQTASDEPVSAKSEFALTGRIKRLLPILTDSIIGLGNICDMTPLGKVIISIERV